MSQGVTGHAGHQLPRAGDPRPTHFFPLHSGVGPDFTERMKREERFYFPQRQIQFPNLIRKQWEALLPSLSWWWLEDWLVLLVTTRRRALLKLCQSLPVTVPWAMVFSSWMHQHVSQYMWSMQCMVSWAEPYHPRVNWTLTCSQASIVASPMWLNCLGPICDLTPICIPWMPLLRCQHSD